MKFFQSEVVQQELNRMQELYMEINKMGLLLSTEQKKRTVRQDDASDRTTTNHVYACYVV